MNVCTLENYVGRWLIEKAIFCLKLQMINRTLSNAQILISFSSNIYLIKYVFFQLVVYG